MTTPPTGGSIRDDLDARDSADKDFLAQEKIRDATEAPEEKPRKANSPLWTDDFASLYSIMKQ